MDRFVTTLQGEEDEVIERESVDSAATMRQPVTNDRYFSCGQQFYVFVRKLLANFLLSAC